MEFEDTWDTTVTENGQITIPKKIREEYKLIKGDKVRLSKFGTTLVINTNKIDIMAYSNLNNKIYSLKNHVDFLTKQLEALQNNIILHAGEIQLLKGE